MQYFGQEERLTFFSVPFHTPRSSHPRMLYEFSETHAKEVYATYLREYTARFELHAALTLHNPHGKAVLQFALVCDLSLRFAIDLSPC